MKTVKFIASDGTRLYCSLWDDVRNPIGVVQIIHGMDEHVLRYDRFARYLNQNGYIVFGDDHRGHGRTAGTSDNIGKTDGNSDIFMAIVSDENEILKYLCRTYDLPVLLFGHSYGSFITQRLMQKTHLCAAGVCLSGTAKYPRAILRFATGVAQIGQKLFGRDAPARLLERALPIRGARASQYLTRDKIQSALHDADPMRAKYFSYGFYYSLFKNLLRLTYNAPQNMPLLIISGSRDIVSLNSRLATALYRTYQANNMKNLTVVIYPDARHELLMDINYADVQRDVLDFFNSVVNARCCANIRETQRDYPL